MYLLEDLDTYNLAQQLSDDVWHIVQGWQPFAKYGMGKQLTSAVDSISSNIAEGCGRYFIKENIRFCFYARGSILETKNWLQKANNRGLLSQNEYGMLVDRLQTIHKKLNSYIKTLRKNNIALNQAPKPTDH